MVATKSLEPVFKCAFCPSNHRDSISTGIVGHIVCCFEPLSLYVSSVSSVRTLEEAKNMKNCLYMALPVQEVREFSSSFYLTDLNLVRHSTIWDV
jgi:hypothetical protein